MPINPSADFATSSPGSGGVNLLVENYTDSGDSLVKTIPVSIIAHGQQNGNFEFTSLVNPLPIQIATHVDVDLFDGAANALISATTAPGASDRGLVVRLAGAAAQGTAAAASGAWPILISNGTDTATITTVASQKALDVAIVSGAGGGSSFVDDAAFTIGTTSITVSGGVYKGTRDSVDDGDGGAFAMTVKRAQYVTLETPNGDSAMSETWNTVTGSAAFPTATTASISAAGPTASAACGGLATVMVMLSGTSTTMTATWQISNDGGTTWVDCYGVRRDTNVFDPGPNGLSMVSESIIWSIDVAGATHFRMNVTEFISYATVNYTAQPVAYPHTVNPGATGGSGGTAMVDDAPFTVTSTSFTPIGGTYRSTRDAIDSNDGGVFAMTPKRAVYTSLETPNADSAMDDTDDAVRIVFPSDSISSIVSAATTNLTTAKASAGKVTAVAFFNNSASIRYVKFYDHASPTVGSTTPVARFMIPASSGFNLSGLTMSFATAIKYAIVNGIADSDATAIGASEVLANVLYR